ncbi:MAG: tricorn protease interacting factor [Acidimicrobiaceae bacterium]|nr:tricorn protease interacting factor [Acidimicrobiaceae bacterium]
MADVPAYRLPRVVAPRRYELTLTPDLDAATFAGEERIEIEVFEPVQQLVLNAIELDLLSAELIHADGRTLAGAVTLDEAEERATIALDGTAEPGQWTLHMAFTGILNDKLHGFYRSTFRNDDGAECVIATTQFEATDARRAFPCWDEPDFKASFKVTLIVDDGLTAVSNASVVEETDLGNGKRQVEFAETMQMSTYLVAFVVGPFEATEPVDVDGVPLRVVVPPGKLGLTPFALEAGAAALRYFASYFGIPYPADKLDLIAVPDFAFGAMENLGAVTFRETALLVDSTTGSRLELERVADVVAHEIAHMWFGDLVTMKWWNGIWLNEAFATFMELMAVDRFRPDWQRWVSFGVSRDLAMQIDGQLSTRPVEFPVGRPEEAEAMFDVLTYQKGCGVLRMLEQYLGAEPFRQGIARYLTAHSHANTETTDLWDAIETASGEPARATMDSWILQGGYPMITVEARPDGTGLTVSQERFSYAAGDDGTRWQVPVMIRAGLAGGTEQRRKVLLTGESATIELSGKADWLLANDGAWGFYRVRYDGDLLRRLTVDMQARLSPLERFGLVSDTWAAVLAGRSPVVDYIELIRLLSDETDPDVWTAILGPLRLFGRVLSDEERPKLEAFVRRLVGPALSRVGWEPTAGEAERVPTLRATLIGALGTVGADAETRSVARDLHTAYLADRRAIAPDLVDPIVNVVASDGSSDDFDAFVDRFHNPANPQEEVRYLYALGRFEDTALLQRTLDLALSGDVRTQNAPYLVGIVLGNRAATDLAWGFLEDQWDTMLARFPSNSITRMLEGIAYQADAGLASRARAFLAAHPVGQGQKLIGQTLERLDVNVAFRNREATGLASALGD